MASVITTARDERDWPRKTIRSGRENQGPLAPETRWIICDQGGNEGLDEWDVVIEDPSVIGAVPGFGAALERADSDPVVIIDSHMRFPENWLSYLYDGWSRYDQDAIYICGYRPYDFQMELRGYVTAWGGRFTRDRFSNVELGWNWDYRLWKEGIMGSCYTASKAVWEKVGGFPKCYPQWGGLCHTLSWRAHAAKVQIHTHVRVIVEHREHAKKHYKVTDNAGIYSRLMWPWVSMEPGFLVENAKRPWTDEQRVRMEQVKPLLMEERERWWPNRVQSDAEVVKPFQFANSFRPPRPGNITIEEAWKEWIAG